MGVMVDAEVPGEIPAIEVHLIHEGALFENIQPLCANHQAHLAGAGWTDRGFSRGLRRRLYPAGNSRPWPRVEERLLIGFGGITRASYEIIVPPGRAVARWLSLAARPRQLPEKLLEISEPANLFPIARASRQKHLLLAAGIGITPFLSYLPVLQARHLAFRAASLLQAK